jgi:hypothetical protein
VKTRKIIHRYETWCGPDGNRTLVHKSAVLATREHEEEFRDYLGKNLWREHPDIAREGILIIQRHD